MKIVLVEVVPKKFMLTKEFVPSLGLGYIASALESKGHKVCILDGVRYGDSLQSAIRIIVAENPDVVGFTATSQARLRAIELIKMTKELTCALTVAGGPHFQPTAKEALESIKELDIVVKGEGEYIMPELIEAYEQKTDLKCIKGIFFRYNGEVVETEDRPVCTELDNIARPAYHLFSLKKYTAKLQGTNSPVIGIISSRGCPNNCIFCANRVLHRGRLRLRNAHDFVGELDFLRNNYGYQAFYFWDDTFTISRPHAESICDEILSKGMKIKWYTRARVNTVDRGLLQLMKKAGCIALGFGIESGSDKVLATINKGITVAESEEAIRISAELGFIVNAFFIVSLPGEIISDIDATLNLMKKFKKYRNVRNSYCFSIIYPGTDLETIAKKEDALPRDFSWHKPYTFAKNKIVGNDPTLPCYENPYLKIEEIKAHILKSDSPGLNLKKAVRKVSRIRNISDIKEIMNFSAKYFLHKRTG